MEVEVCWPDKGHVDAFSAPWMEREWNVFTQSEGRLSKTYFGFCDKLLQHYICWVHQTWELFWQSFHIIRSSIEITASWMRNVNWKFDLDLWNHILHFSAFWPNSFVFIPSLSSEREKKDVDLRHEQPWEHLKLTWIDRTNRITVLYIIMYIMCKRAISLKFENKLEFHYLPTSLQWITGTQCDRTQLKSTLSLRAGPRAHCLTKLGRSTTGFQHYSPQTLISEIS